MSRFGLEMKYDLKRFFFNLSPPPPLYNDQITNLMPACLTLMTVNVRMILLLVLPGVQLYLISVCHVSL